MKPLVFISSFVSKNYENALYLSGFDVTYTDYDEADGLLLPGGGDVAPCLYGGDARKAVKVDPRLDQLELFLLEKFTLKGKPVLGVCRGAQVINVFFGGTLTEDFAGHSGAVDTRVKCFFYGQMQKLFGKVGFVKCNHHQKVQRLCAGARLVAVSDDMCAEAFTYKNVLAVQFHPERTFGEGLIDGGKVFDLFKSYF